MPTGRIRISAASPTDRPGMELATGITLDIDTARYIEDVMPELLGHMTKEAARYFLNEALHGIGLRCRNPHCGYCNPVGFPHTQTIKGVE